MGRRLTPASLHAHARGSVLVPVNLLGLPDEVVVLGERWAPRPEHHVTALSTPWVAAQAGVGVEAAWRAVAAAVEGRRAGPVRVGEELRLAREGAERTIVVMAHVDGLAALWEEVAARVGIPVPAPPTHITLVSRPGGEGIGLHDAAALAERSRVLGAREAAEVRDALGLDALLA